MKPNQDRLTALRGQANSALATLRNLRDRETQTLSNRRGLRLDDDRLPGLDAAHLRLVRDIRAVEITLAPLQAEIEELEAAQRAADVEASNLQRSAAEAECAEIIMQRLDAAAVIDHALAELVAGFRAWERAGHALARHSEVHGRDWQTILNGRALRGALIAASDECALPKALEISRSFDGNSTLVEAERDLWAAFLALVEPKAA